MARVLERRPAMRITGATSELPPAVAKLWVGYPGTGPAMHKSWLCFTVAPRSELFCSLQIGYWGCMCGLLCPFSRECSHTGRAETLC